MGEASRWHRFGTLFVGVAMATLLPPLAAVAPARAQLAPPARAVTPVVLQAAPGDRDTFVPPPVRARGADGQAPSPSAPPPSASIQLTFASGFPAQAVAPVQAALDIWEGVLTSSRPIAVRASYSDLGSGTLASAGPPFVYRDFPGAPVAGTWYPPALAEAITGDDVSEGENDVNISINERSDWYFGIDGNTPSGRYDLMSVVLHEFLHGLGFLGTMRVNGGQGRWGLTDPGQPSRPDIFDRKAQDLGGQGLLAYTSPSVALANALQGNRVYFSSPQTNRGTGDRVQLFAPNPWNSGSSFAHLDEDAYPAGSANSLATPYLNSSEAVHAPGPLALCMLEAMGWTTTQSCIPPATTQPGGFTWYAAGGFFASGSAGTIVRAYATGGVPGRTYKLVSGLDGGPDRPCMWDTQPINVNNRVANGSGFIGTTAGVLNRGPGQWQICFREEGSGATLQVTAPALFLIP